MNDFRSNFGFMTAVALVSACSSEAPSIGTTASRLDVAFAPATVGCAMAHCDTRMSDWANADPPRAATTKLRWHDTAAAGARAGLGCSSNGSTIVCSYGGTGGNNIVAYDPAGNRRWTSGTTLGENSWQSAPLVTSDGSVIAADDQYVVRFAANGDVVWKTKTPGGIPISPVVTDDGIIVLATKGGPVSAYRASDGVEVGELFVRSDPSDPEFFETVNTPCVSGHRVYVATQRTNDTQHTGRLVAIDIVEGAPLTEAWHFEFGGPSGGSPLRIGSTIYFDGASLHPGDPEAHQLFAVRDDGAAGTLVFAVPVVAAIQASPSQDPRGGFWVFPAGTPNLLHLDANDGHLIESLDLDALVGASGVHLPSSAMTMAGTPESPVMLVSASPGLGKLGATYVTAIDLPRRSLAWKVKLANARAIDWTAAQFAIAFDATNAPIVVFPGFYSGAYAVGQ